MSQQIIEKFLMNEECKQTMLDNPNLLSQMIKLKGPKKQNILHILCNITNNERLMQEVLTTSYGRSLLLEEDEQGKTPLIYAIQLRNFKYINIIISTSEGIKSLESVPDKEIYKTLGIKCNSRDDILLVVRNHVTRYGVNFSPSKEMSSFFKRLASHVNPSYQGQDVDIHDKIKVNKIIKDANQRMAKFS